MTGKSLPTYSTKVSLWRAELRKEVYDPLQSTQFGTASRRNLPNVESAGVSRCNVLDYKAGFVCEMTLSYLGGDGEGS